MSTLYDHEFFTPSAPLVARALLGATLVRCHDGQRISGKIVETEAYSTRADAASHSHRGQTPRNAPMWEAPGFAYVYLTYGVHWLFNIVCEPVAAPAGVLIRAIEPLEGETIIAARRVGRPRREWTSGPGRLTRALDITGDQNRVDLTTIAGNLWIETGVPVEDAAVCTGPRIGLGKVVSEPWLSLPWRWWIADNPHVSR